MTTTTKNNAFFVTTAKVLAEGAIKIAAVARKAADAAAADAREAHEAGDDKVLIEVSRLVADGADRCAIEAEYNAAAARCWAARCDRATVENAGWEGADEMNRRNTLALAKTAAEHAAATARNAGGKHNIFAEFAEKCREFIAECKAAQ